MVTIRREVPVDQVNSAQLGSNTATDTSGPADKQDYEEHVKLLSQQYKKKLHIAREEQDAPPAGRAVMPRPAPPEVANQNYALQDTQIQLMLQQQSKKRLMMARQQQENMAQQSQPTQVEPRWIEPNPQMPAAAPGSITNHLLQDYQMQLMLLEQQNKKRLKLERSERAMFARRSQPTWENPLTPPRTGVPSQMLAPEPESRGNHEPQSYQAGLREAQESKQQMPTNALDNSTDGRRLLGDDVSMSDPLPTPNSGPVAEKLMQDHQARLPLLLQEKIEQLRVIKQDQGERLSQGLEPCPEKNCAIAAIQTQVTMNLERDQMLENKDLGNSLQTERQEARELYRIPMVAVREQHRKGLEVRRERDSIAVSSPTLDD